MPKNVGKTNKTPNVYHGILFPQRVLVLSDNKPTIGVAIPSEI